MTPNNPMTEGEALAVLRQIADEMRERKVNHGKHYSPTLVAWANRIDEQIAALAAHTAASAGEIVAWQWYDEAIDRWEPYTPEAECWKENPPARVRALYTAPPAAVPADALTVDDAMVERACVAAAEASEAEWPAEYTATELAELRETMRAALTAALIPKGADHEQR